MKQGADTAHGVMVSFYCRESMILDTWLKTSSTGSSESTWTHRDTCYNTGQDL